jgi:predicted nucleic acid-binding protein
VILVDTSVWVDHLRTGNQRLKSLLHEEQVLTHPFVIGELACGAVRNREEVLGLLKALPGAQVAEHDEVLRFIGGRRLYGRGIGWVDAHLLASALLSGAALWTFDRELSRVASALRASP